MRWEMFEYFLMPFGFTNMMNDLLGDYFAQSVFILSDDALLDFAKDKEHAGHLEKAL